MIPAPAALSAEKDAAIRLSFSRQGLMQTLGVEIVRLAPGEVDLRLPYSGRVVRVGKRLIVTTAEVVHHAEDGTQENAGQPQVVLGADRHRGRSKTACAVMQQTIATVPRRY